MVLLKLLLIDLMYHIETLQPLVSTTGVGACAGLTRASLRYLYSLFGNK